MRSICYKATLLYYDGPQIIEARDSIGGYYVGVSIESANGSERFVLVGVKPRSLHSFRIGKLDLKSLMLETGREEWYLGTLGESLDSPMDVSQQVKRLEETDFLPDDGFFLEQTGSSNESTLIEARRRQNLVMEITLNPPESSESHRIHVHTLANLLSVFQLFTKHAYGRANRDLTRARRSQLDTRNEWQFDVVVPASAGSFKILLEASKRPNLLGLSEISRALQIIDQFFTGINDPRSCIDVAQRHRGHVVSAYLRLLRILTDSETGMSYTWAEPSSKKAFSYHVGYSQATNVIRVLSEESNLEREEIALVGALRKVDMINGTWRLETEDGVISGERAEKGPTLGGLETDRRYRFNCLEVLTTDPLGREESRLYLLEHSALDE